MKSQILDGIVSRVLQNLTPSLPPSLPPPLLTTTLSLFLRYDKSDSAKSEPRNARRRYRIAFVSFRFVSTSVKFDMARSPIPSPSPPLFFRHLVCPPLILPSKLCEKKEEEEEKKVDGTRGRRRGREGEEEKTGCLNFYRSRMFEMAEPEVVLCQNMPIPSTGISFMAGLIPFRHGNPSGPCSTRVEENVNSEKENTRITRRTVPSFPHSFVKFLFSLSLSLPRTLDTTTENIFIRFSRFRPERGNFFSFLFFLSTIIRDTYIS